MSILKPIKLLPARERVASSLRKAIILKEFEPGHELMLDAVAKMLGVSVTPVREAFQILAREGFIQLRPNKGAIVMGITPTFLEDHYEIRASLESEACAIICRKKKNISEIIKVHEDAKRNHSFWRCQLLFRPESGFHFAIWNAAKMRV
jgi:DNA-binding GntR family transcriptional regulator